MMPRTPQDVESAVREAKLGHLAMAEMSGAQRIKLFENAAFELKKNRGEFVEVLMAEAGKLKHDAEAEVNATIERLRLVVREARGTVGVYVPSGWTEDTKARSALITRVPLGVIAVIGPFNYPLFIPAAKAVPALLAGNSVVVKPASATPLSMLMFGEVLDRAGFPRSAFNVVVGKGSQVGKQLVTNPDVAMISFTGGTEVGDTITRTAGIKRLQLELGGKGIAIVLEDANIPLAAKKVVEGSLKNSGQRCDAVSLILYCGAGYPYFLDKVKAAVKAWGEIGPLIDMEAADRVVALVNDADEHGARLICGGRSGKLIKPHLLVDVPLDARIVTEETFGPVVTVMQVKDEDEAVRIHEASKYGLDSSIFSRDLARALRLSNRLKAGSVTINDYPKHGLGLFPYGGSKQSGLGREGIEYSLQEMTELKTIVISENKGSYMVGELEG